MRNNGWTRTPLGKIADVVSGYAFKSSEFGEGGVPVIKIKNIRVGYVDLSEAARVDEAYLGIPDRYHVRAGDILISLTGSHISQPNSVVGRVARHSHGLPSCLLNQRAGKVIVKDPTVCDPRFLFYALGEKETVRAITLKAHGAANQANVSPTQVESVEILLPPFPIQGRIAAILSTYDDLIENNTQRIQILERMAQGLYREWFVHFRFPGQIKVQRVASPLGPVPQGWQTSVFTEIADILSGGTPSTSIPGYWDGDIPWFTPRDATGSFYVIDTEKYITQAGVENCASELYPKDTIFITARGTVGKLALAGVPMAVNQSCYAVRAKSGYGQCFLFFMLHAQIDYLKKNTGGATFDTIITDTFTRMSVIKPPTTLAYEFERLCQPLIERIRLFHFQNTNLRRTRDLLLPKLISGALDVSNLDIATRT